MDASRSALLLFALTALAAAIVPPCAALRGCAHAETVGRAPTPGGHVGITLHGTVAQTLERASDLRVALHGADAALTALPLLDGSFSFEGVREGEYLLEVLSTQQLFPQVRVAVSEHGVSAHSALDRSALPYPLHVRSVRRLAFLQQRPPFNVMALLKSPMVILVGISAVLLGLMKVIDIDPEEMQRTLNEHKGSGGGDEPSGEQERQQAGGSSAAGGTKPRAAAPKKKSGPAKRR